MSAFEHAGVPDEAPETRLPVLAADALRGLRVAVVGAGAFGGWTALALRRAGADVTLIDAWGPGNARSSSGDETRVIRATYGPSALYTGWTVQAFNAWHALEALTGRTLLTPTGALWLFSVADDRYVRSAVPVMAAQGRVLEELTLDDVAQRFPQFSLRGVRTAFLEPGAGFLRARLGCQVVAAQFVAEGGHLMHAEVKPGRIGRDVMGALMTNDGGRIDADRFVFACGPWLGRLFPKVIGAGVTPTRQELFYFGTPAGNGRYEPAGCPVWLHAGQAGVSFGIPGNDGRGMKVGDDVRGPKIDPTRASRAPTARAMAWAKAELAERLPGLAGAPFTESRTCVYENSPDGHLILDRHPAAANVWLAGGGSGHGYKLGPAVGQHLAGLVGGAAAPIVNFGVARLAAVSPA